MSLAGPAGVAGGGLLAARTDDFSMTLIKRDAERIASLEGLRGVAALTVVFFHARYLDGFIPGNAHLFVDLFFVISGFVMARAYETTLVDRDGLSTFVWRRFGRLYPLFLFSTLAFLAVRVLQRGLIAWGVDLPLIDVPTGEAAPPVVLPASEPTVQKVVEVGGYLLLLHGLGFYDRDILNFPSWSISTEFYTYLLFGAICLTVPIGRRVPLYAALSAGGAAVAVAASVVSLRCLEPEPVTVCFNLGYHYGMARCVAGFFAGCLLARLPRPRGADVRLGMIQAALVLAVLGLMAMTRVAPSAAMAVPVAMGALVYAVSGDTGTFARMLSTRPFQFLGEVSYSVYLLHVPLAMVFDIVIRRDPNWLAAALFVPLLVGAARLSFLYVETPSRDWFRRRFKVVSARLEG